MGKQQRNKRHRRGKRKEKSDAGSYDEASRPSALLQRLRHADEGTRLAALSALELNPSLLASKQHERLLDAVRDQVMGNSMQVATQACVVMIAYISTNLFNEDIAASWMNLLVQRLRSCLNRLQTTDALTMSHVQQRQIHDFASRCLECFALLTEVNPLAMKRILRSQGDVLSALYPWLEFDTDDAADLRELAAQCLHSVFDDNSELVAPWLERPNQDQPQFRNTLQALETTISAESTTPSVATLPTITRLHAVGAWLSVWRSLPDDTHHDQIATWLGSQLESCVSSLADCLHHHFALTVETERPDSITVALSLLESTYTEWVKMNRDMMLESEILALQSLKNESARSIARRLKKKDDEDMPLSPPASSSGPSLIIEPEASKMDNHPRQNSSEKTISELETNDAQFEWEMAKSKWMQAIRPLQLSLEILLSLTSVAEPHDWFDDDQEDTHMLDTDELSLVLDESLMHLLVKLAVPQCIQSLLPALSSLLIQRATRSPEIATESLSDLVHKAGTVLGHMLSKNFPVWEPPPSSWSNLFAILQQFDSMTTSATHHENNVLVSGVKAGEGTKTSGSSSCSAVEGITTAMVMGLQARRLCLQLTDPVVSVLVAALRTWTSSVAIRNVVCILGLLLCGQPNHSAEVNELVARALLQASESSLSTPTAPEPSLTPRYVDGESDPATVITGEVCNALMDIYGSDDCCHREVFDNLKVSFYLERMIPVLRRGGDTETALNARRFVQYMKEQS